MQIRRAAVVLALSGLTAGVVIATAGTPASADPLSSCTSTVGARVAVDYGHFSGPVAVGCDATLTATTRGIDLLTAGGFTTKGTQHDGPRFVCRIATALFPSPDATVANPAGTGYPTPAQDACVVTPPTTAYWSYWIAPAGQNTWTYNTIGAFADHPANGEVEAWVYGATDVGGTTGQPTFTPNQIRARTTPTAIARLAAATTAPDLTSAVHYLTTNTDANDTPGGTSLAADGYYDNGPDFADWGLTIDGAFALAATGTDNTTLAKVVAMFSGGAADPSGDTAKTWSGLDTAFAQGGSIGKEALLAEVTGFDPRGFGGSDLIAALDHLVCTAAGASCTAPGDYAFATSTFSQSLGVMAQLRANDAVNASAPIAYLESLQETSGAWSSTIPAGGDSDVDSTAMAVMALALVPGDTAAAAVAKGVAWIAGKQTADGGFPGAAGDSTNSTALAVQALTLDKANHQAQLDQAVAFLAGQQNSDGGFTIAAGTSTSDMRASTQAVSGVVGTSFGTLTDDIATDAPPTTTTAPPTTTVTTTTTAATTTDTGAGGIDTTDASSGTLPFTGVNVLPTALAGLFLLFAGVGLLLLQRRRAAVAGRRR